MLITALPSAFLQADAIKLGKSQPSFGADSTSEEIPVTGYTLVGVSPFGSILTVLGTEKRTVFPTEYDLNALTDETFGRAGVDIDMDLDSGAITNPTAYNEAAAAFYVKLAKLAANAKCQALLALWEDDDGVRIKAFIKDESL